ncbi:hypothetical protein [Seonamhaeicola maritimus]|uniref:hypothetical protein n=1 Tax=Seonamhaeicola maritimus TaxID=2591822 RepID=UPI0024944272|nr:hypothetical protein [Seonamhaeicola maritimus]
MSIGKTIAKATLLSTCIFWFLIFCDDLDLGMLPFVFLSMIPICLCCSLVIIFTIAPFFWICNKEQNGTEIVFQWFFPFYAIACFCLCAYGFWEAPDAVSFFTAAFFTSLQSWVWLAKKKVTKLES